MVNNNKLVWQLVMLTLVGITNSCISHRPSPSADYNTYPESLPIIIDSASQGFELGVSAMFTGQVGNQLIVAGGCNFPDLPVAEGGKKQFYDDIYALPIDDESNNGWTCIGHLPKSLAYGACVVWHNQLICIGGQNAEGGSTDVFTLSLCDTLTIQPLPSLPQPIDNAYAALLGDVIYLAGGNAEGVPNESLYSFALDDAEATWQVVAQLPDGPRVQPVMAGLGDALYLWGGFCPKKGDADAYVNTTGWRYIPASDYWTPIAAPPSFVGGGCALPLDAEHILCVGGVNADIFERAIRGEFPNPAYLLHDPAWYRFNRDLQCYNVRTGLWSCMDEREEIARAGAGIARLNDGFVVVQGEVKPGIRTPQMTRFRQTGLLEALTIAEQLPLLPRPRHIVFGSSLCMGDSLMLVQQAEVQMVDSLCNDEAYCLEVSTTGIRIIAQTPQGVYWAHQTLAQLSVHEDGKFIGYMACRIEDWPSFRIRGVMQDVGRSYISLDELKREIATLSHFKINTFHWHLTENQAWRLESKRYPQLNDPAITTRMPGQFYTQEEARDLVRFCQNHGMILIPEIDVPGHSGAFERAFGCSMQSEEGTPIVAELLDEACEVFSDVPYFHIGTDEVQFTNLDFVPQMVARVRSHGKKVISWNPGWKYEPGEVDMTHLWSYRGKAQPGIPAIDSKFHYLNHYDTFADLVALYSSRIYNTPEGTSDIAGTILALWHDRFSSSEIDMIRNNHLYPNMLAIAERAWIGGGSQYFDGSGTVLTEEGSRDFLAFAEFEDRMLWHLHNSCPEGSYCYVRQSHQRWVVTDAFPNEGDLSATFPPETEPLPTSLAAARYNYQGQEYIGHPATGAGMYLRHVWGPNILPGFYPDPQPNHTAYAYTWVYSEREQQVGLWVETQNYSRSEKDFPPLQGTWDYKGSRVWLNGEEVQPPHWSSEQMVHDNELPLGNENIAVRNPIPVSLHQGWNNLLLKLPVGDFNTPEVRLVKWMFAATFTTLDGTSAASDIRYCTEQQQLR